jgi:hypothetical protein
LEVEEIGEKSTREAANNISPARISETLSVYSRNTLIVLQRHVTGDARGGSVQLPSDGSYFVGDVWSMPCVIARARECLCTGSVSIEKNRCVEFVLIGSFSMVNAVEPAHYYTTTLGGNVLSAPKKAGDYAKQS